MSINDYSEMKALDALEWANFIAVAPFVFQAVKSMQDLGILQELGKLKGDKRLTKAELAHSLNLKEYAVSILLDLAVVSRVVIGNDKDGYRLSKVGVFLLEDPMTKVNFNFTSDVCYEGLKELTTSLKEGRAAGLEVFTKDYKTIYPFLSSLPKKVQESWFAFDHFYSDHAFDKVIAKIFTLKPKSSVKLVCDVGGNTGRFAKSMVNAQGVDVCIIDLKEQCALANEAIKGTKYEGKITTKAVNILAQDVQDYLPKEGDIWFMSQFLDCFAKEQISYILDNVYRVMPKGAMLVINEVFGDRQENKVAKLVIEANSLYFTALANGVSRFYHADELLALLGKAGFKLLCSDDTLGMGHTVLFLSKE